MTIRPFRSKIGPVESLVLEAWGIGVQIDCQPPPERQSRLVDILRRAREIDAAAHGVLR